jgi:hypothetical protein
MRNGVSQRAFPNRVWERGGDFEEERPWFPGSLVPKLCLGTPPRNSVSRLPSRVRASGTNRNCELRAAKRSSEGRETEFRRVRSQTEFGNEEDEEEFGNEGKPRKNQEIVSHAKR